MIKIKCKCGTVLNAWSVQQEQLLDISGTTIGFGNLCLKCAEPQFSTDKTCGFCGAIAPTTDIMYQNTQTDICKKCYEERKVPQTYIGRISSYRSWRSGGFAFKT